MTDDEIFEALESTATNRRPKSTFGSFDGRTLPSKHDVQSHKGAILRFLGELDGDVCVNDVREALGRYAPGYNVD
jgi:hypothetical protein